MSVYPCRRSISGAWNLSSSIVKKAIRWWPCVTSQFEQCVKFQLLTPVRSTDQLTPCLRFTYHLDHFGTTWGLVDDAGAVCHTGCVAFGMDRLAVALFAIHGIKTDTWPAAVKSALGL